MPFVLPLIPFGGHCPIRNARVCLARPKATLQRALPPLNLRSLPRKHLPAAVQALDIHVFHDSYCLNIEAVYDDKTLRYHDTNIINMIKGLLFTLLDREVNIKTSGNIGAAYKDECLGNGKDPKVVVCWRHDLVRNRKLVQRLPQQLSLYRKNYPEALIVVVSPAKFSCHADTSWCPPEDCHKIWRQYRNSTPEVVSTFSRLCDTFVADDGNAIHVELYGSVTIDGHDGFHLSGKNAEIASIIVAEAIAKGVSVRWMK